MSEKIPRFLSVALILALALAASAGCAPKNRTPGEGASGSRPAGDETTSTTATAGPGAPGEASDLPSALALDVVFRQVQSMEAGGVPLENTIESSGRVTLAVDASASPPKVSGEGSTPVTGGGHVGALAFTNSGTITYRLAGEIARGPSGRLELHLGGERSMDVKASGPGGPSASTPFEDVGERVLAFEDGSSLEWSWQETAGGVTGSAKWTLRVPGGR